MTEDMYNQEFAVTSTISTRVITIMVQLPPKHHVSQLNIY